MGAIIHDDIIYGGGGGELPIASADTLGGIKVGDNLSIDANGVLSGCVFEKFSFEPTEIAISGSTARLPYPQSHYSSANPWLSTSSTPPNTLEDYGYFNIGGRTMTELVEDFSALIFLIGVGSVDINTGKENITKVNTSMLIPLDDLWKKTPDANTALVNISNFGQNANYYEVVVKNTSSGANEKEYGLLVRGCEQHLVLWYRTDVKKLLIQYNAFIPIRMHTDSGQILPWSGSSYCPLCYGIKR